MPYNPISNLGQQGFSELTRILLTQQEIPALLRSMKSELFNSGLADDINLILFHPRQGRVCFHGLDEQHQIINYEDETILANGPVQLLQSNSAPQVYPRAMFTSRFPHLEALGLYPEFEHYCLLPLITPHGLVGGCELLRRGNEPFTSQCLTALQQRAEILALAVEHVQQHQGQRQTVVRLRHERDDYRVLVDVTNAVLSKLDLDDLIGEISKEIHKFFGIVAISIVLSPSHKDPITIYSTHYFNDEEPEREQYTAALAGTLTEKVMTSGEMLLVNLQHSAGLAPYEQRLFTLWQKKIQTLCVIPLSFGNKRLGVLKLAQCQPDNFTSANLRVLQQIAERIAIAVDNALAYQEINRLKETLVHENLYLTEQINGKGADFGEIVGRSRVMSAVLKQVEVVAKSDCTVLILGETGTGKELIARAIHNLSDRVSQRMVKMNCAAMPAGLLESDLFGHEKGSFTGATAQRMGRFELAHNGSLFLDEVGDIPLELQPKLLRVLQEREFERVGGNKLISVDVRLIAATNRNLKQMVDDREFRSDLYYRLNVFPIVIPPLRERPEDIPQLVKFFTYKIAKRMNRTIDSIPAETLRLLSQLPWPGNVRELENVIERAVLLTRGTVLTLELPELQYHLSPFTKEGMDSVFQRAPVRPDVPNVDESEYQRIVRVLRETNGVVAGPKGAAQRLGLKRTTLLSRMKKLGIH